LNPDPYWIQIWIGIQPKMLDPDPYQINTDPQPWRKEGEKEEGEEEEEKERDTSEEPSLLESVMRASTLASGTRPPGIEEGFKSSVIDPVVLYPYPIPDSFVDLDTTIFLRKKSEKHLDHIKSIGQPCSSLFAYGTFLLCTVNGECLDC
jgi:hypothetical protein